ncbi:OadG family protein [Chloroflexota bacterium]
MVVDWAFAGQVGGVGFGAVFVLLIILGVIIWLVGKILNKMDAGKAEVIEKKKGG